MDRKPEVEASVEKSCVLYGLYSEIFRESTHENTGSLLLFVFHPYHISANTSVTIIVSPLFHSFPLKDLMEVISRGLEIYLETCLLVLKSLIRPSSLYLVFLTKVLVVMTALSQSQEP